MRVLVTGGAGYIGSHTAKALDKRGHDPIVLDNLKYGHRWAVRWGPLIEADLSDQDGLRDVLHKHQIGAVLHFAGASRVGESMHMPAEYFRNNVCNMINLLDAMCDSGVRHIVFSSTCATYGNPEHIPIREEHPQHPLSPYGESKLIGERVLKWYGGAYGLSWTSLRYFNAAGADLEGQIGEVHSPETHLIPRAIAAACGDLPHLEIFGTDYETPDGTAVRDYVHVADLASAHVMAVERLAQGGSSIALNLGSAQGHSVLQVIAAVEKIVGGKLSLKNCIRRAGDPPVLVSETSLAYRELKWAPIHSSLDKIVETAAHWYARSRGSATLGAEID
jgi:UDP-arabinose 4-epimerase